MPNAFNKLPKATPAASARSSRGTKSNNTKTKITKHTSRVGSKAAPKTRHRQFSPVQDYNFDSVPRGDTQSQIVVALTRPGDEDVEGIEYEGEEEEENGFRA